ncbi:MAG: PQQ-binding-like beta-propeller repeat protein [Cyclobacteriaceae bacterium]
MSKTIFLTMVIFVLTVSFAFAQMGYDVSKYPSGDREIDRLRKEVFESPTTWDNYDLRLLMMKLWAVSLQQQGVWLGEDYYAIDQHLNKYSKWNPVFQGLEAQVYSETELDQFKIVVKNGYTELNRLQKGLKDDPKSVDYPYEVVNTENPTPPRKQDIDWSNYKANPQRTGFSGADGPVKGEMAWEFPVGLRWESKPLVVENDVYLASPGMRNIMWKLDLETGKVKDLSTHVPIIRGDQLFSTPAMVSSPVLLEDHILLREIGSRGNKGIAKDITFINRKTGEIDKEIESGHVDYKMGYAPLDANEKYTVFPYTIHDIEERPPLCSPFTRIICKDTKTGKRYWDFNIGPTFSDPLLEDNRIYVGNQQGDIFCLKAEGIYRPSSAQRISWELRLDGAVNRKVEVDNDNVYVGTNAGSVYCLDKVSGEIKWQYKVSDPEPNAFRHFSTSYVVGDKVFIGSATKKLLSLDKKTGKLLAEYKTSDWVRSRPVADESFVYVVSINGEVSKLDHHSGLKEVWKKQVGDHYILSDLVLSNDRLLLTNTDLYAYCLDTKKGKELWKHSVIKSFMIDDYRVLTDQVAGGAYYESKPTAAQGKVFIGSPNGFLYAVDADSGKEVWKFEVGGSICGAPVIANDKVYFGSQGGEEYYYCVNVNTGKLIWKQLVGWVWGSANYSDGMIYLPGVDGYVNCLNAETGTIVWRYRTERSTCSEPLIIGDHVFFGSWDHFLYKFDKKTGENIWKYQLSGGSDSGSAISGEGKIFLPVGGGTFRCLDPETKEVLWTPALKGKMYNVTPGYHNGTVFLSCLNGRGLGGIPIGAEVFSVDSTTGNLNWTFNGGGGLTGPVIGANDRVYFASTVAPYLYCVDQKGNNDGTTNMLWRVHMANKTEESVPAIYNGKIFILNSGGYLTAIE